MKTVSFLRHYRLKPPHDNYDLLSYQQLRDLGLGLINPSIQSFDQKATEIVQDLHRHNPFEIILHAPSPRATQTAQQIAKIINPSLPVQPLELLKEIPFDLQKFVPPTDFQEGGLSQLRSVFYESIANNLAEEGLSQLQQRATKLKQHLINLPYHNILCVSHGFFIPCLKLYFNQGLNKTTLTSLQPYRVDYLTGFTIKL